MSAVKRIQQLRKPRGPRTRSTAPSRAVLCLALLLAGGAAAAERQPVSSSELLPGVTARIGADGTLRILQDAAADEPLLATRIQAPEPGGRFRTAPGTNTRPLFLGRAAEGCPGGHRGLSAKADDDRDGLVDEDPLDGVDNDGDGLVDEDFAAVSDAMIAISGGSAAGDARLEYYRWGYARLRGTVFATVGAEQGSRWVVDTGGAPWADVRLATTVHSVTGRSVSLAVSAFVSRLDPGTDCRAGGRWVGVAVLDDPQDDRLGRAVLDGRSLAVDVGPRPLAVAVCTADSWLQLTRLLAGARRIRDGVADPVTGERTPWVVAPACPACRDAAAPAFTWRVARDGDLVLSAVLAKGRDALPDPDLLRVGDERLGAPMSLDWRPDEGEGEERGVAWSCATAAGLARGGGHGTDPYAALDGIRRHGATGRLELRYLDPDPAVIRDLSGGAAGEPPARKVALVTLDGRRLSADLRQDLDSGDAAHAAVALMRAGTEPEAESPAHQSQLLRSGRSRPQLAPDLLQGGPNPFRDVISLRFRVPDTIGDAFIWDDPEERPTGLDLAAPVPWRNGAPRATVKVYSMSGQELVTLYTGETGSGETTVTWNGTDSFGRAMASGTYFCKLQLDDWSVTRRLVYLR